MKTALITGGSSGVGASIAKALIHQGYKVVLIGSNLEKGKGIEDEYNSLSPQSTEFVQLDLSCLSDVQHFIGKFTETHERLDVLANIAGILSPKREVTKEGFERTFTIGYLSSFLFSTRLSPLLEKAPNGRIVNVAGGASTILNTKLDFDNLDFAKKYNGFRTAIATVHAKSVLTEILSEKYAAKGIDVNSFHPGMIRSNLMRNLPLVIRVMAKFTYPFFSASSENGIYVCSSQDIKGTSGKLFIKKKAVSLTFEKKYKDRLWQETEAMLETL